MKQPNNSNAFDVFDQAHQEVMLNPRTLPDEKVVWQIARLRFCPCIWCQVGMDLALGRYLQYTRN